MVLVQWIACSLLLLGLLWGFWGRIQSWPPRVRNWCNDWIAFLMRCLMSQLMSAKQLACLDHQGIGWRLQGRLWSDTIWSPVSAFKHVCFHLILSRNSHASALEYVAWSITGPDSQRFSLHRPFMQKWLRYHLHLQFELSNFTHNCYLLYEHHRSANNMQLQQ